MKKRVRFKILVIVMIVVLLACLIPFAMAAPAGRTTFHALLYEADDYYAAIEDTDYQTGIVVRILGHAVIIGHGLDANLTDTEAYAKIFARYGIAAYVFDFIGGGSEIRSDGDILDMTVLTETEDMLTVLDGLRALDAVDVGKLFLMGCSQGGYVATCAAAKREVYVRGLIAFYPAYGLMDDVRERTAN